MRSICKIASVVTAFFIVFSSFNVYAMNKNLVVDEYNGWMDVDVCCSFTSECDGFDGFVKYVNDDDGCFYTYFWLYDTRLNGSSDENIVLSFTVENSVNEYRFSVNNSGFLNASQNEIDGIELLYNYDNCSAQSMGGQIFVAFRLRKDIDRTLLNYIKCEYASGVDNVNTLFEDIELDMYVEPTTKKVATTAASTAKVTTTKAKTSVSKASTTSTTKFKGTGSVKVTTSQKYSPKSTLSNVVDDKELTEVVEANEYAVFDNQDGGSLKMSKSSIVIAVMAVVIIAVALVIILVCAFTKTKKVDNNESVL